MSELVYEEGDATCFPEVKGTRQAPVVIAHCVNDLGKWGKGFVLPLRLKYPMVKDGYKAWASGRLADGMTAPDGLPGWFQGWSRPQQPMARGLMTWLSSDKLKVGQAQIMSAFSNIEPYYVANLCGQKGIYSAWNPKPFSYEGLSEALTKLRQWIVWISPTNHRMAEVRCPKIGAGLARGDWGKIEAILKRELVDHGIRVTVLTL